MCMTRITNGYLLLTTVKVHFIFRKFFSQSFVINEYLQVLRRDKKPLINQSNKQKTFVKNSSQVFPPVEQK